MAGELGLHHPGDGSGRGDSGKTTLTYLIPRLYDPSAGIIRIDGHDLRDVTLELRLEILMPGDFAVRAGEHAHSMYFVSRGELEVLSADSGERLRTLREGDFFGEVALLYDDERTANVRALGFCHVYRLDRDLFDHVLDHYPDVATEIRSEADRRRGIR